MVRFGTLIVSRKENGTIKLRETEYISFYFDCYRKKCLLYHVNQTIRTLPISAVIPGPKKEANFACINHFKFES